MCRNSVLLLVVVSVHVLNVAAYHWRDWNGTVPHDAVIGAVDGRGVSYIARAWLPNFGIYAGQVFPEQTEITIAWGMFNVASTTTIQVLCSDSNDVAWIASNKTLTSSLVQEGPENLVIGGITSYDDDLNQVYIGKFSDSNGNAYVGNVYRQYYIYWADELDQPKYSEYYELLITTENRTSKNSNKDSKN